LTGHFAKVSGAQIAIDILEVRMIEQIEEFEPELKDESFRQVSVLVDSGVGLG